MDQVRFMSLFSFQLPGLPLAGWTMRITTRRLASLFASSFASSLLLLYFAHYSSSRLQKGQIALLGLCIVGSVPAGVAGIGYVTRVSSVNSSIQRSTEYSITCPSVTAISPNVSSRQWDTNTPWEGVQWARACHPGSVRLHSIPCE